MNSVSVHCTQLIKESFEWSVPTLTSLLDKLTQEIQYEKTIMLTVKSLRQYYITADESLFCQCPKIQVPVVDITEYKWHDSAHSNNLKEINKASFPWSYQCILS